MNNVETFSTARRLRTGSALAAMALATMLAVSGCATGAETASSNTMAEQVEASNLFVKEPSMPSMTGMFGDLSNTGSSEVVLVGGSSDVAGMVEIHEVVDGEMQAIAGGLKIAAGETSMLMPGGNHVMLMDLKKTLLVGDEVTVTLKFSDGSTTTVTAPVKTVAGGEESYEESHSGM